MIDSAMVFGVALASCIPLGVLCLSLASADARAEGEPAEGPGPVRQVYKTLGEHELTLKVYAPSDAQTDGPRPAIVFFFGGGFLRGSMDQFEPQARYLAGRGMVAITADYRVRDRHASTPVDSCLDGRSAIRWVRAHAAELGVDPNRIVASGGSAGGIIALMAGLVNEEPPPGEPAFSSRPDAVVAFNPPVVYAPVNGRELRTPARLETYRQGWGRDSFREISAWHHITPDAPPTLIHVGDEDFICPIESMRLFARDMQAQGVRCELLVYEGQGHGFFNAHRPGGEYFRKTLAATDRFLASLGYLQGEPTIEDAPSPLP